MGVLPHLLLGVAQAFHYTLLSEELIDLYRAQVTAAKEQLKVAKARFKAGNGMRIDVIRAETDVERTYLDLLAAHLAYDNARDSLGELIGSGGLPMPDVETKLHAPPGTQESWASQAASERVDVAAARAKLDLTEDQKTAARMQFLPNLSAAWQGTYQFTDMPDMGSSDRSRWAAVLTLTVPIYNHFRYGDLDRKRAAHRQAELELEGTLRDASLRVRKSRRDYQTALASVETAAKQSNLAEEGLKIAEAAYGSGAATSLDVTQARRDFTETGVNLATQKLKAQIALLNLLDAVGSGFLP